jgi:hypothetical protein
MLEHLTARDRKVLYTFCFEFLSRFDDDQQFAAKIVFVDEDKPHVLVNRLRHDLRIWDSNNSHENIEHT